VTVCKTSYPKGDESRKACDHQKSSMKERTYMERWRRPPLRLRCMKAASF